MGADEVGSAPVPSSAPPQARKRGIHPDATGVEEREVPGVERSAEVRRIAESLAPEHGMQLQLRPGPSGAVDPAAVARKGEELDLDADPSQGRAERLDADPHPSGTAGSARGEEPDPHRCTSAQMKRAVEPGGPGQRPAARDRDRLHQTVGEALRPPVLDDRPAGLAHGLAIALVRAHLQHEIGELVDVVGIEGEAVDAVAHEIRRAAAAVGDQHGQARGHGLVDHQTPLLGGAGVDEGAGQAIVDRQLVILLEAGEKHVPGHSQLVDPAHEGRAQLAVARDDEAPMVVGGAGAVEGVGFEHAKQVLLLDETAAGQEEPIGKPEPAAPAGCARARSLCAVGEVVVVDHVVAAEDLIRRKPERAGVVTMRSTGHGRRAIQAHDATLDRLAVRAANRVPFRTVGHQDCGTLPKQAPQKRRQGSRL